MFASIKVFPFGNFFITLRTVGILLCNLPYILNGNFCLTQAHQWTSLLLHGGEEGKLRVKGR